MAVVGRRPAAPTAPAKTPRERGKSIISSVSGLLTFVVVGLLRLGVVVWAMIDARNPGPLAADKIVNIVREDDGGRSAISSNKPASSRAGHGYALTLLDGNRSRIKRGEYFSRPASA